MGQVSTEPAYLIGCLQWAAVKTHWASIKLPPQRIWPLLIRATWKGRWLMEQGFPPMIRDSSSSGTETQSTKGHRQRPVGLEAAAKSSEERHLPFWVEKKTKRCKKKKKKKRVFEKGKGKGKSLYFSVLNSHRNTPNHLKNLKIRFFFHLLSHLSAYWAFFFLVKKG